MILQTADLIALVGIGVVILTGVALPSFFYVKKKIDRMESNHLHALQESLNTLDGKVDKLAVSVSEQFGLIQGWDLDNRVTNLERSNTGDGPYRARRKHSR